jgi:hypothetical protein
MTLEKLLEFTYSVYTRLTGTQKDPSGILGQEPLPSPTEIFSTDRFCWSVTL